MARRWQVPAVIVAAVLLAGCGGSGSGLVLRSRPEQPGAGRHVGEGARGHRERQLAPEGGGLQRARRQRRGASDAGGFAVLLSDGGLVVVLVLDSSSQADIVEQGMKQAGAASDALVTQAGRHVYAANTAGTTSAKVTQDVFDKIVAAGEGDVVRRRRGRPSGRPAAAR